MSTSGEVKWWHCAICPFRGATVHGLYYHYIYFDHDRWKKEQEQKKGDEMNLQAKRGEKSNEIRKRTYEAIAGGSKDNDQPSYFIRKHSDQKQMNEKSTQTAKRIKKKIKIDLENEKERRIVQIDKIIDDVIQSSGRLDQSIKEENEGDMLETNKKENLGTHKDIISYHRPQEVEIKIKSEKKDNLEKIVSNLRRKNEHEEVRRKPENRKEKIMKRTSTYQTRQKKVQKKDIVIKSEPKED